MTLLRQGETQRKRVGIIGGGQLGLMLAESLGKMNAIVSVYDPSPDAPARRVVGSGLDGAEHGRFVCAPFDDLEQLAAFLRRQDVVTYEFESIDLAVLRRSAQESSTAVIPHPDVLAMTRSRIAERSFIQRLGLPCAPFRAVSSAEELDIAIRELGYPIVIKTDRGGYDGKGQWVIGDEHAASTSIIAVKSYLAEGPEQRVLVERRIDLIAEVSCIVAAPQSVPEGTKKSGLRAPVVFPVFENSHQDQILDTTVLPCSLESSVQQEARKIALACAAGCALEGLLTIEFFYGRAKATDPCGDKPMLFINEFAPRPHNSGHITRRATSISQFDALALCLLDVALPEVVTLPLAPGHCYRMKNILGRDFSDDAGRQSHLAKVLADGADNSILLEYFDYGKAEIRNQRKMGHILELCRV
jgi:5-(carboxyamino)imidazole ribonucleotide synthase